jgi:LysR family glycine cleavage system transcriptional activator
LARRLPPLNALRAFEAAARHLSFLKAADELAVTPAAVSQQIKQLEAWIGTPLFRRRTRGVLLTDVGQEYWPKLRDALDALESATRRVTGREAAASLGVSAVPSVCARWLIPRLGSLRAALGAVEVRILAENGVTNFDDGSDVAVRQGPGPYPGLRADLLFPGDVFPVCSPRLLEGPHPLRTPADLAHATLIHEAPDPLHEPDFRWPRWLDELGVRGVDGMRGPQFTYSHMAVQAAIAGHGVALAALPYVADDLVTGQLVRPFPDVLKSGFTFWIVCPEARAEEPNIAAFRRWALAEAAASRTTLGL